MISRVIITLGVVCISVIVLILFWFLFFLYGTEIAPYSNFYIKLTDIKDNSITVSGDFHSSGTVYKGHEYTIKNNILYISIKQGSPTNKYRSGSFSFEIKNDFTNIEYIYLKDHKETFLLWDKNKG